MKNLDNKDFLRKEIKKSVTYKLFIRISWDKYRKNNGQDAKHIFSARNKEFLRTEYEKMIDRLVEEKYKQFN